MFLAVTSVGGVLSTLGCALWKKKLYLVYTPYQVK
jgi:hypothetical protein